MIVTEGSTNVSVPFYFVDDVGGTNPGEPTTGLLFSNIETGGSASYQRQGAARVDFTLVTQTAAGAHTDGGFVLIDDTEMPGVYRCDIPDAAVAAGVDFVIIYLRAATASNTITRPLKIDLTSVDLRDSVRGGMTSLPNAAADAAGGLVISDAGGLDMDAVLSGHTPQTGDSFARLGAPAGASVSADIAAVEAQTDDIGVAGAGLTAIPWNAAWDAEVESECNDAIVSQKLDHLVAVADADDVVDNSIIAKLANSGATADWSAFVNTTDSLQAVRDHIGDGTNLTEAGGTGDQLSAIPWNAAWDAEVESEVNDALDTAIAELGVAAPTATPTIRTGLMLLYMALRNKTVVQTSGTDALEIYNNAGTKIAAKLLTDDGSDYTEAEMA